MKKIDKVEFSGIIVLSIGIILLSFTFICAYGFLVGGMSILGSQNIVQTFGQAFAPLVEAIIRVLYLGIMGWIGSIPTTRGVQLLRKEKAVSPVLQPSVKRENNKVTKEEKPKAEITQSEKLENVEQPKEAESLEKNGEPEKCQEPVESPLSPVPTPL